MSKSLSQQHGEVWEAYIAKECAELERRGSALVSKNWEAPKVPGKQVKRSKSKPDYSGCIAGGRHVVFEAKATLEVDRFDLKNLRDHQLKHLTTAAQMGAIAFVYVLAGDQSKYIIPVSKILAAHGCSSVRFNSGGIYAKRPGETWFDVVFELNGAGIWRVVE